VKRAQLRKFVERFLELNGGRLDGGSTDLLRARLPLEAAREAGEEAAVAGQRELVLAFGARAHREHPDAEFVAIGSSFLERTVAETLGRGRHTVVHLPAPPRPRPPKFPPALPAVEGRQWGAPVRAARPLFLFVYLVEYHTIDVRDDLVLIAYDPARPNAALSPHGMLGAIGRAGRRPEPGWPPLSAVPTTGDLLRSLDLLDRRLQRQARLVKEASAIEIARETANIEAYYRQLIEEARHPAGRSRQTPEDEDERVRQMQLDWKRRVQEVSSFWEACGDVRLSAVAAIMEPCWVFPLKAEGARGRSRSVSPPYAVADWRGQAAEPVCPLCGSCIQHRAIRLGQDLVCESHG